MRLAVLSLLALLVPIACSKDGATGDGTTAAVGYRSGARIKVRVLRAGDVFELAGLRDAQRNEPCEPRPAADGELRCLPTNTTFEIAYTDATCQTPIAVDSSMGTPCAVGALPVTTTASLLVEPGSDTCGVRRATVYALGAPVGAPSALYRRDATGACTGGGPVQGKFVAVGAELPPSSFVKLRESTEARGEDLSARFIVGDDGLRVLKGARDTKRQVDCDPAFTAAGARCIQQAASINGSAFSDNACSTKVARGFGCEPRFATEVKTANECDVQGETSVYALGTALSSTFVGSGGACAASAPPLADTFAVGAQVDAKELPALERVVTGTGPIRVVEWRRNGELVARGQTTTPDGEQAFALHVGDAVRWAPPTRLYVSPSPAPGDAFADSACTTRLVTADACDSLALITMAPTGSCQGERVFQRGARHDGPAYTLGPSNACVPLAVDAKKALYAIGAEVPATSLAEAVEADL